MATATAREGVRGDEGAQQFFKTAIEVGTTSPPYVACNITRASCKMTWEDYGHGQQFCKTAGTYYCGNALQDGRATREG